MFAQGTVCHYVTMKPKETFTEDLKKEMYDEVRKFPQMMPETVVATTCGPTFTTARNNGYECCLLIILKDHASLDPYRQCDVHQAFLKKYSDYWESVHAQDFVN